MIDSTPQSNVVFLPQVVYCSLTDFQQTVYQTVLDTEDVTLLMRSSEKCDCRSGRTRRSCCYKVRFHIVYCVFQLSIDK